MIKFSKNKLKSQNNSSINKMESQTIYINIFPVLETAGSRWYRTQTDSSIFLLSYFWHMASAFWPILDSLSHLHSSQREIVKEIMSINLYTPLLPTSHCPERNHTATPNHKGVSECILFKFQNITWQCLKHWPLWLLQSLPYASI